ncbi:MAG: tRNA (N(6)-L-threonylcarbamoyladenosine(37)-C(2))-methylthiotransferase MtaB, partial [Proteobacteria bacterium]|nr:tRNA (N(6)-L-threonylcarbamoyladenosine(37)-C(2))-methylthiotransferase MtaB [Pseudomonadota bacterium]
MQQKQFYIKHFGCKVNLSDSHSLAHELTALGYGSADSPDQADVIILNTCSVTHQAEKDARYILRKFHRLNPKAVKLVTGCYGQTDSLSLAEMVEVDYVIPNEYKHKIASFIHSLGDDQKKPTKIADKRLPDTSFVRGGRLGHFKSSLAYFGHQVSSQTRAFLKIQDGCNDFCTYCQIPYARGASRSVAAQDILHEIDCLKDKGVREIVLTGIHLGEWGKDLEGQPSFVGLLEKILLKAPGCFRVRLSSLEPSEFSQPLADLLSSYSDYVCHHLHFPLQSGSDHILKLMGRRYNKEEYFETVSRARSALGPKAHLSCDVMVGFPGETEQNFHDTIDFLRVTGLVSWHVFSYSPRPNTAAARFSGHLSRTVIQSRSKILRNLSAHRLQEFSSKFFGQSLQILWEGKRDKWGRILGKSSEYLR